MKSDGKKSIKNRRTRLQLTTTQHFVLFFLKDRKNDTFYNSAISEQKKKKLPKSSFEKLRNSPKIHRIIENKTIHRLINLIGP